MKRFLDDTFTKCIADMHETVEAGKWSLEAQVRVYDLLEYILGEPGAQAYVKESSAAAEFCAVYETHSEQLMAAYDEAYLHSQVETALKPLKDAMQEAASQVDKMTDLHDCAKQTYEVWQNGGYFARRKSIRILRQKAGFRLETKRIGNYVARTFDLLNAARADYAHAQQAIFLTDMSYKIKPDILSRICRLAQS